MSSEQQPVAIALDVMGGDWGVSVNVQGAVAALRQQPNLVVHLFGREEAITPSLKSVPVELRSRLVIHHCADEITMEDQAGSAARTKKDSSMVRAVQSVADKMCHGVVSAGHSGAMMACCLFILRRIKGVERPAIMVKMPTTQGFCVMLDMGANVDCKPQHLVQFALMGNAYARTVEKTHKPRVALLSNGEESHKGNEIIRDAAVYLEQLPLNFKGFVEGHDIHTHGADVIVCDGFVGNIVLKTSEGLATAIMKFIKQSIGQHWWMKLGALSLMPAFRQLKKRTDASEVGAAPLLGVQGNAFICHGRSNARAIENALYKAHEAAHVDLAGVIASAVDEFIQKSDALTKGLEAMKSKTTGGES